MARNPTAVKVRDTGNPHRNREIQDTIRSLMTEAETLPDPKIRESFRAAIQKVADDGDLDELFALTRYRRTPVDIEEFMFGNVYLGLAPSEIYPGVMEALLEITSGKYVEAVLKGSIGCWPGDAEFLSPDGWVRFDQYAGELVAEYDIYEHSTVFRSAEYVNLPADGWFEFTRARFKMKVSPEHKVLLRRKDTGEYRVMTAEALDMSGIELSDYEIPKNKEQGHGLKNAGIEWVPPVEDERKYCFHTKTGFFVVRYNDHVMISGNSGKTTISNIGILYELYKISCLRNPQITFGVQRNSSLVFTIQSVRLNTAKKAVFQELGAMITHSPYFNEVYPYDRRITSEMIFREQRVSILPVSSSDTGAISLNCVGGMLDEANFLQKVSKSKSSGADLEGNYDQAKVLYETLSKRRRSRFLSRGQLPGVLFLVSSSRYPDDFTEKKAAEAESQGGPDPQIYVYSKSLWEAKGRDRYSPESFRVLLGSETVRPRILGDDEPVPEGGEVVDVPEDLRVDFVKDIDGAIRDLAGRTTLAVKPFIRNREAVYNCMGLSETFGYQPIFRNETVDLAVSMPEIVEENIRTDVKQMRVAHVDLGLTRDAAGLAIGHVAGIKTLRRVNPDTGEITVDTLPVIGLDGVLRIIPPMNEEIDFSKIRQIIYTLNEHYGMGIKVVTTDGFQSSDFKQILRKKGYMTDYLSVDRNTEPYMSFRTALYDGRVFLPRHQTLLQELVSLEITRDKSKEKVDHPANSTKDVSDAVCGVVSFLLTRRASWNAKPTYFGEGGYMLYGNRTNAPMITLPKIDDETQSDLIKRRVRVLRKKSGDRKSVIRSKKA